MTGPALKCLDNLQLLRLLLSVYNSGQLTTAARENGLSVSAASRQLARMKEEFEDPLFLRTGTGLVPTAYLRSIIGKVKTALEAVDSIAEPEVFAPEKLRGTFRILCPDNGFASFIAPAIARITRQAPHLGIEIDYLPAAPVAAEMLRSGQADLCISPCPPQDSDIFSSDLACLQYALLMNASHPLAAMVREGRVPTIGQLAPFAQVVPTFYNLSQVFPAYERLREVGATIINAPYLMTSPLIALDSDAIVWMPSTVLRIWSRIGDVIWSPIPEEIEPNATPKLFWSTRGHTQLGNQWVRSIIISVAHDHAAADWFWNSPKKHA